MSSSDGKIGTNVLQVKLLDLPDLGDSEPRNVVSFFRDIGTLNSMFKKRIAQLEALHICSPFGKIAEEYLQYQRALESKYGVNLSSFYHDGSEPKSAEQRASLLSRPMISNSNGTPLFSFTGFNKPSEQQPSPTSSYNRDHEPTSSTKSSDLNPGKKRKSYEDSETPMNSTSKKTLEPSKAISTSFTAQLPDRAQVPKPTPAIPPVTSAPTSIGTSIGTPNGSGVSQKEKEKPSIFSSLNVPKKDDLKTPAVTPSFSSLFGASSAATDSSKSSSIAPFNGFSTAAPPTASKSFEGFSSFSQPNEPTSSTSSTVSKDTSSTGKPIFSGFSSQPQPSTSSSSSTNNAPTETTVKPFSFSFQPGAPNFGGFQFKPTDATSIFGQGQAQPKKDDEDGEGGEDGEEAPEVPPVVEDVEVAEPDALISRKCKLLYMDGGWKTRGTGTAHLKKLGDKAAQLLVRTATSLGTILLNARLDANSRLQKGPGGNNAAISFLTVPVPEFKGVDPKKPYQFVVRFKDEQICTEFHDRILDLLK